MNDLKVLNSSNDSLSSLILQLHNDSPIIAPLLFSSAIFDMIGQTALLITKSLLWPVVIGNEIYCLGKNPELKSFSFNSEFKISTLIQHAEKIATFALITLFSPVLLLLSAKEARSFTTSMGLEKNHSFEELLKLATLSEDFLKLSAFMQADSIMINDDKLSKYQGGTFFHAAKALRNEVEKYADRNPQVDFKKEISIVREYEKWCYTFLKVGVFHFVSISMPQLVAGIADELRNRIMELRNNEEFLIPITLGFKNGGFHVITAKIKKEDDKIYSIYIYNAGWGCDNHQNLGKDKVKPLQISNISKDEIINVKFLSMLIEFATFKRKEESEREQSKFYAFIRGEGDWKWSKSKIINVESASKEQRSGICIWRSPMIALRNCMEKEKYKEFVFFMKQENYSQLQNYKDSSRQEDIDHLIKHAGDELKLRTEKKNHKWQKSS